MASPPNMYVSISSSALCMCYPAMCTAAVYWYPVWVCYAATFLHIQVISQCIAIFIVIRPYDSYFCCCCYWPAAGYMHILTFAVKSWLCERQLSQHKNNCSVATGICSIRVIGVQMSGCFILHTFQLHCIRTRLPQLSKHLNTAVRLLCYYFMLLRLNGLL